jgi:hypothetical protein
VDSGVADTGGGGGFDSSSSSDSPFEQVDTGSPAVDTGSPEEAGTEDVVVESPTIVTCTNCPLIAQYLCAGTMDPGSIAASFQIVNNGVTAQDLTEVTLRYWFTADTSTSQVLACDYTALAGGCASVTGTFVTMATPTATADHYMEMSFSSGSIPGEGGTTGPIQTRIHDIAYVNMTQSNDYSFNPADTAYTPSMQITLYRAGMLVWGTEP